MTGLRTFVDAAAALCLAALLLALAFGVGSAIATCLAAGPPLWPFALLLAFMSLVFVREEFFDNG